MTDEKKLIAMLDETFAEQYEKRGFLTAQHTADFLLLNGVIVPPCKVGDTVYQIDLAGNIYESKISKIIYDTNGIAFDERAIGKSIFLSREVAEETLTERGAE